MSRNGWSKERESEIEMGDEKLGGDFHPAWSSPAFFSRSANIE